MDRRPGAARSEDPDSAQPASRPTRGRPVGTRGARYVNATWQCVQILGFIPLRCAPQTGHRQLNRLNAIAASTNRNADVYGTSCGRPSSAAAAAEATPRLTSAI